MPMESLLRNKGPLRKAGFNLGKGVIQSYSFESFHDNRGQSNRL